MNERSRAVYAAVKAIQEESINAIKPGRTWKEHEKIMREIVNTYLAKLGLLPLNASNESKEIISRKYFPRGSGHFLCRDAHDTGEWGDGIAPGMVITCEPGIYIPEEGI